MITPVVLRAADRKHRSWKNGGGRTSEVAAFPPGSGMDDFEWRVSIADVDADGPFSVFPMVERHIVLLAGTLCLRFEDSDRTISVGDEPFSFLGSSPVVGNLIDCPVRDLNLMVRRGQYEGSLQIVGPGYSQATSPFSVVVALQAASVIVDNMRLELQTEDALFLSGPTHFGSSSSLILAQIRQART